MFGRELIGKSILAGVFATSLVTGGSVAATAQEATPEATPAAEETPEVPLQRTLTLIGTDGQAAGFASLTEGDGGLTIKIVNSQDSGLEPGDHGVHLHETGDCNPAGDEAFATAGGHYNPTDMVHGGPQADPHHAGDLGNLTVNDDGSFAFEITVMGDGLTLDPAADPSLADEDGSAIVIHQDVDDLKTDPSGNSDGRIACGIVVPSTVPVASPAASPVASPVS